MTGARIIEGDKIADELRTTAAQKVDALRSQGHTPHLDAILVGDPGSGRVYARSQQRRCQEIGIEYNLHTFALSITDDELQAHIDALNRNQSVSGIMLNLPLPDHLDTPAAQYAIDPYKDVEGVHPANIGFLFYDTPLLAPCTALAVLAILEDQQIELKGARIVIVGQGPVVGKPIALGLMAREATVIICNKYTRSLAETTRTGDILISAAGVPGLIGPDHVKPGATVIDVGINRLVDDNGTNSVVGDVEFEAVRQVAGAVTPVPGGVGPVTVALLLNNAVDAAAKQLERRRFH